MLIRATKGGGVSNSGGVRTITAITTTYNNNTYTTIIL